MTTAPTAALAVGANIGDRLANICGALQQLADEGIRVVRHSRMYESAAAYVTDQPPFLNAALAVQTDLSPMDLLAALKRIEAASGRDFQGRRYGPRPLDLDIIFYQGTRMQDPVLQLPHPRWQERSFVLAPLADLYQPDELAGMDCALRDSLAQASHRWQASGGLPGEAKVVDSGLQCVLPMGPRKPLWPWQGRTLVMGVLNVTPDSFSDGGLSLRGPHAALQRARQLVRAGADILDVGGQSTRPGAAHLAPEKELERVLPVIRGLAADEYLSSVPVSVDTFSSQVAREAVAAGADMVNDISGGRLDPEMHAEVARLNVPYVLMHMRGDPRTMQSATNTAYTPGALSEEVGQELQQRAEAAIAAGLEPWRIILDPGIGFAKTRAGNCELIRGLPAMRRQLKGALRSMPLLVGPSRKGFLGSFTGKSNAAERDTASAVAAGLCIAGGADIIRMHDAGAGRDAAAVADAVIRAPGAANRS